MDVAVLAPLLHALAGRLADDDLEALDVLAEVGVELSGTPVAGTVEQIIDKVRTYDFSGALELLPVLAEALDVPLTQDNP